MNVECINRNDKPTGTSTNNQIATNTNGTIRKEKKKRIHHVGSYEVGKTLGNGSFGKVKLGVNIFTRETVAIKFIKENKLSAKQRETCLREIEIMKLLDHPNIVKLIDVVEKKDDGMTFLIVEYVSGGELFDYIVAREYIKEREARKFFRQIISAIEYCHSCLVVHRDLKPENLLIDANGNLKISDFGLSNMIMPGKLMDSFCGSPLYAAPEILKAEKYLGPPVDIWSLGVILYAILCGSLPWEGDNQAEISYHSVHGKYVDPPHLSREAIHIMRRMIQPNPKERATLDELKNHPWTLKDYDGPPPSFIPRREPVHEIKEELLVEMASLGFTDIKSTRELILNNNPSRAVSVYHLLLENHAQKVQQQQIQQQQQQLQYQQQHLLKEEKKATLKSNLSLASIPEDETNGIHHNKEENLEEMIPNMMKMDERNNLHKTVDHIMDTSSSKRRQSTPTSFSPTNGEHITPISKYSILPASLSAPDTMSNQQNPSKSQPSTNNELRQQLLFQQLLQQHQQLQQQPMFQTQQQQFNSNQRFIPPLQLPSVISKQHQPLHQHQPGLQQLQHQQQNQLNHTLPNNFDARRRSSIATCTTINEDKMMVDSNVQSPRTINQYQQPQQNYQPQSNVFNQQTHQQLTMSTPGQPLPKQQPQQQQQYMQPPLGTNSPTTVQAPRTKRRMSLDSRMTTGQGSEGGPTEKNEQMASPRMAKGVFQSSTTTTKSPEKALEEVKRVLDSSPLFVKKKSQYVFLCYDEEGGVKFQIEIVKIHNLNLTGVQLKRISGDTWKYKDICTELVETIHI